METKPWLRHYDEGVPITLQPYPRCTLLDVIGDTARQRPDHTALFFKGTRISYAKLEQLSDAFAAALVAQGVEKEERVAMLLPNVPQFVICQLGAWKAGALPAPINPLYTEHELGRMLAECGAETVVVMSRFYNKVSALHQRRRQYETNVRRLIVTNVKEYLSPLLRWLFTLRQEKRGGHRVTLHPGDLWLDQLLRKHSRSPRPKVSVGPEDPALLLFTGGTTGTPKAALGTHRGLLAAGMQLNAWFGIELVDWDDAIMLLVPLNHVYGNVGVLCTGLVGHNPLILVPDPRALGDLLGTIRRLRPAFVPGVPTLFNALLKHPAVQDGRIDFRSIKLCISGAAPLMSETKRRFEELTGGRMVEAYGLTESMLAAIIGPLQGTCKPGGVGLPLPDVEVRIVDAETGERGLPPGQVGELVIRAPQIMAGYWQRPEETAETVRHGWLYTGDLGHMDEDGYVFIVGRKKDLIKPSGFQVWPREVEEVIASHPAVHQVGVAGVTDVYQGEAVKAWVVLRTGQSVSADELRAYCRRTLAGYKVPRFVEFRDSLPLSKEGKVLRRQLTAEENGGEP